MINKAEIEKVVTPEAELAKGALAIVKASGFVVKNDEHAARLGKLLQDTKRRWNTLEEFRKSITGPMVDAQRNANAFFKRGQEPLAELERALKGALGTYEARKEEDRRAAMKAQAIVPAPAAPVAGVTHRTKRSWRIVNEEKVPRQFCSPDRAKIEAHFRNGGLEAIPGVEFFDEIVTAVRT
jgi:hypothetical protein